MFRKTIVLLMAAALFAQEPLIVTADGGLPESVYASAAAEDTVSFELPENSAAACCLLEVKSKTVVCSSEGDTQHPMGHLAKLMTVLLCAEACGRGELSMSDTVTASANANSKQGAQIWLDAGEEITVEELMKSIIIGNANDACCALAETLSGSEGDHVTRMNERADRLGMTGTRFADVLGESADTVSTARDIALLCGELSRHEELDELFTTRIDAVRGGKAELVSTNRLILSYKGIRGTKACRGEKSGECIAATAERNGMTLCAVLLGEPDSDVKLRDARELLDFGFESCRLFTPEIDKQYLRPVTVTGGCADKVRVTAGDIPSALIAAGTAGDIELTAKLTESLTAPVKRGQPVGTLTYTLEGEPVLTVEVTACSAVDKMDLKFAVKRTLLKLLDISR